uniref:hypothetical protein n=1 Tax=Ornithinimicrobium sufpigmenti TaxID=2508882 RepID=UPI0037CA5839
MLPPLDRGDERIAPLTQRLVPGEEVRLAEKVFHVVLKLPPESVSVSQYIPPAPAVQAIKLGMVPQAANRSGIALVPTFPAVLATVRVALPGGLSKKA